MWSLLRKLPFWYLEVYWHRTYLASSPKGTSYDESLEWVAQWIWSTLQHNARFCLKTHHYCSQWLQSLDGQPRHQWVYYPITLPLLQSRSVPSCCLQYRIFLLRLLLSQDALQPHIACLWAKLYSTQFHPRVLANIADWYMLYHPWHPYHKELQFSTLNRSLTQGKYLRGTSAFS